MSTAEELWLAQNTIECAPYAARISRALCATNQARPERIHCPCAAAVRDVQPLPKRADRRRTGVRLESPAALPVAEVAAPPSAPTVETLDKSSGGGYVPNPAAPGGAPAGRRGPPQSRPSSPKCAGSPGSAAGRPAPSSTC